MLVRSVRNQIAACIAATFALATPASTLAGTVTNCNNAGAGSLRDTIANAANGDTILFDTLAMNCATITLTTGALHTELNSLTLQGPVGGFVVISGNHSSAVITHGANGPLDRTRKLTLRNLKIANGYTHFNSVSFTVFGGCVFADGDVTLDHASVYGCKVVNQYGNAFGGGIAAYTLHMDNSSISNSGAYGAAPMGGQHGTEGGGAFIDHAATIVASSINGNRADMKNSGFAGGGGLFIRPASAVSIDQSTISGNTAVTESGTSLAGGLYVGSSLAGSFDLTRSTISGNSATIGAGLYAYGGQMALTLQNNTINGNTATKVGAGAVIGCDDVRFVNNTIVANSAASEIIQVGNYEYTIAAGLSVLSGTLLNTIVALNVATVAADPGGASDLNVSGGNHIAQGSHNLIMKAIAGSGVPADTLASDPMLGPSDINGGLTQTRPLLAGSPAIDAGTRCVQNIQNTDQRGPGFPRIWGNKIDIGAYEYGVPAGGGVIFRDDFNPENCIF